MNRSWCLLLLGAVACARGGADDPGVPDAHNVPDARPPDAPSCTMQTFYRDMDGDSYGDPASSVMSCMQPAGTVTNKNDCDDTTAQRRPGLAENCDGLDNDCNAATPDGCPANCTPVRRPPPDNLTHIYLVCNTFQAWTTAKATCNSAMYKMVEIENASENTFVRNTGDIGFGIGASFFIGGTDAASEGNWVWDDGQQFWQGGPATGGGIPIGGRFSNWTTGEPNAGTSIEDCVEMRNGGVWNDLNCAAPLPFICRR